MGSDAAAPRWFAAAPPIFTCSASDALLRVSRGGAAVADLESTPQQRSGGGVGSGSALQL